MQNNKNMLIRSSIHLFLVRYKQRMKRNVKFEDPVKPYKHQTLAGSKSGYS